MSTRGRPPPTQRGTEPQRSNSSHTRTAGLALELFQQFVRNMAQRLIGHNQMTNSTGRRNPTHSKGHTMSRISPLLADFIVLSKFIRNNVLNNL